MPSDALADFFIRSDEAHALVESALKSRDAFTSSLHARCAVVLATAAVERYMNDVLDEACRDAAATEWDGLSAGRQRLLLRHMANVMGEHSQSFLSSDCDAHACTKLTAFVRRCARALDDPSTWDDYSTFGIFGKKLDAVDKLNAALRAYDNDGRDYVTFVRLIAADDADLWRSFSSLVRARHTVAHALPAADELSAADGKKWIDDASLVIRYVDLFLGYVPDGGMGRLLKCLVYGPQLALPAASV